MINPGRRHIAQRACGLTGFITLLILFGHSGSYAADSGKKGDTIFLKKGVPIYVFGSVIVPTKDTFLIRTKHLGNAEESKIFYDSVYSKFSRKKWTRFVYTLAFRQPDHENISDSIQVRKSESPFVKYKGKIIRNISIISLDPFGTNVEDTSMNIKTGVGKFLNGVHKKTYPYVIRNNLQIKKGKPVDPNVLADNERHLRELPYIHEVRTIIENVPHSDSVDITIVTQDVWTIGFDFITITPSLVRMRLYDASFLGTGNRLSFNFSTNINRAPFFFVDGLSYRLNNISGTFIDVLGSFSADDNGNQTLLLAANRDFYSNKVIWAGGALFEYRKAVSEDIKPITSYLDHQLLWLGKAWFLEKENRPTRLVAMESYQRVHYSSRPVVTIDTNRGYYNTHQIITGFAYSRNNFYNSDYLVNFGKTEVIPYGNLFQLNFGPELTDFYNRFYGGFSFSGGNFFRRVGYFSAQLRGGGFYYKDHVEDIVLKFSTRYITPALTSPLQLYKIRSFFVTDFRIGLKQRFNNTSLYNLNDNFDIEKIGKDSLFLGTKSLSATLSTILYTPWYFFGFRFALTTQIQGGWIASSSQKLLNQPFYVGMGAGIMTRNNNLIFPAIIVSAFYYPNIISGVPAFQLRFLPDAALHLPDFNPHVPGIENIQN